MPGVPFDGWAAGDEGCVDGGEGWLPEPFCVGGVTDGAGLPAGSLPAVVFSPSCREGDGSDEGCGNPVSVVAVCLLSTTK